MTSDNANPRNAKISTGDSSKRAEVVQCDVCLAEVSPSLATSAEGLDYVHYFCWLDCLQTWLNQAKARVGGDR